MTSRPVMSWINLGEVAYIAERRAGSRQARHVVRELRRRVTLDLSTDVRVLEAAHIKARYAVAYADAFAVATAARSRSSGYIILGGCPSRSTRPLGGGSRSPARSP